VFPIQIHHIVYAVNDNSADNSGNKNCQSDGKTMSRILKFLLLLTAVGVVAKAGVGTAAIV